MAKPDPDNTGKKHSGAELFKPGQSGNPAGRPKGARSKLGEAFIEDLAKHWKDNGKAALADALKKDPAGYIRVVASLLPRDFNVKHTIIEELEGMSEDELRNRIERLERVDAGSATVSAKTSVH